MSEDTSEPYKRRKVDSPIAEDASEQWLETFQKHNLVSRLEARSLELKDMQQKLDKAKIEKEGLAAQLASLHATWVKVSPNQILADTDGLCECLPTAPQTAGPIVELLSRYPDSQQSEALHAFTVGAYRRLLTALDVLTSERDALKQELTKAGEPQSPGQADLSCPSCVRATLKVSVTQFSTQCSELQAVATSVQLALAQKSHEVESLAQDLETSRADQENLRLRWQNSKKAASCICACRCGARAVAVTEDLEDVKQLKQQLLEIRDECDRLKTERDSKQQECIRLELETTVSEERFIGSKAYKCLLNQAKGLLDRLSDERRQYKSLDKKLEKQRREHDSELKELRNKYKETDHDMQKKCKEFLKQVERLTHERDAKAIEVTQLQERLSKWDEHINEFRTLSESLESELANTRAKVADYSQSNHALKQRSEELDRQVTDVKLQLTDRQEKVAALNQHIAELTSGVPPEPNIEARVLRLQKEREDLIHKLKARDEELHQLKVKLGEFSSKLKSEQEAFNMMHKEYDLTAAAFDKESKKAKALYVQVAKQDRDMAQLLSEKVRFEEERRLVAAERQTTKDLLTAKDEVAAKLREESTAQAKLISEYAKSVSECRQRIKDNEDQLARATQMYENNLKEREETLSEKEKAIELCKVLEGKLAKSHTACAELTQRVQQLDQSLARAHEDLLKVSDIENLKSTDEALTQQIARFRVRVI